MCLFTGGYGNSREIRTVRDQLESVHSSLSQKVVTVPFKKDRLHHIIVYVDFSCGGSYRN